MKLEHLAFVVSKVNDLSLRDRREVGAAAVVSETSMIVFGDKRLQHLKNYISQHGPSPNSETVWSVGLTSAERQQHKTMTSFFINGVVHGLRATPG